MQSFEEWYDQDETIIPHDIEEYDLRATWDAAIDSADKIAMDYHISQVGRNNTGLVISDKIKELKS